MSLVDRFLARRSVMFTSPLSVAQCRDRIGPDSPGTVFGSGANAGSPFIVNWRSEGEVTLTKPWSKWSGRRRPHCSLRVRFDSQPDGTFVEVGVGVAPFTVVNYALIWLFFAGYALANLSSVLHSPGGNPLFTLGFCGLLGPWLYVCARAPIARQGPDLVSSLESLLDAVTSPAL